MQPKRECRRVNPRTKGPTADFRVIVCEPDRKPSDAALAKRRPTRRAGESVQDPRRRRRDPAGPFIGTSGASNPTLSSPVCPTTSTSPPPPSGWRRSRPPPEARWQSWPPCKSSMSICPTADGRDRRRWRHFCHRGGRRPLTRYLVDRTIIQPARCCLGNAAKLLTQFKQPSTVIARSDPGSKSPGGRSNPCRRRALGHDRGREGFRLPSLRTVRAVFPHTALQSVVSSSGLSRLPPSCVEGEQPSGGEESIGPSYPVFGGSAATGSFFLLAQHRSQPSSHEGVDVLRPGPVQPSVRRAGAGRDSPAAG